MRDAPSAGIKVVQLTFSDNTVIDCEGYDIILLVGPNNVGKSASLREIQGHINHKSQRPDTMSARVIRDLVRVRTGSQDAAWQVLREVGQRRTDIREELYNGPTGPAGRGSLAGWESPDFRTSIEQLFVRYLGPEGRQVLSNDHHSIDFGNAQKTHPLHFLHQDRSLRKQFSDAFKRAFGQEVAIDLLGGSTIPLYVGEQALPLTGETEIDDSYRNRLRSYPRLQGQGDGMRSFAGILLHCMVSYATVILIDEPEAFLHPPQARLLGRQLADLRMSGTQLIIATHSSDFVRGVLECTGARTKVIRVRREGDVNVARELAHEDITGVWGDPVLRYSNVLDGLFYEKVIVCEADGDCRFYHAIADSLREPDDHPYLRDIMFTQAGGKGGIPKLALALRKLEVPVATAIDFDILRDRGQFIGLLRAFGFDFASVKGDYEIVREHIERMGLVPLHNIKRNIESLLSGVADTETALPAGVIRKIQEELKPHIGWRKAKRVGVGVLDPGSARRAGETLLRTLSSADIFVVPFGELESFEPLEAMEKNEWVNKVLEKHQGSLANAPDLQGARDFVAEMIASDTPPV